MQLNQQVRAYLTLIRLSYILVLDLLCVLFIITFQRGLDEPRLTALAVITVALVTAGGAAINDYCDRDSDALTHPERPIPAHRISPARAAQLSALTFFAGLAISLMINVVAFGIVALNVVLFILYPRVIKRLSGFLSNLVMGYLGATIPLFAGAVVFQTIDAASLSFVGLIAGGAIGLNVLKDILTLEGDLKVGYPTLAATRGVRVAATVGALFLLLSAVTSPVPYLLGVTGIAYLLAIAVWTIIAVYMALALLRGPDVRNAKNQLTMFIVFFPYLIGAACVAYAFSVLLWGIT